MGLGPCTKLQNTHLEPLLDEVIGLRNILGYTSIKHIYHEKNDETDSLTKACTDGW